MKLRVKVEQILPATGEERYVRTEELLSFYVEAPQAGSLVQSISQVCSAANIGEVQKRVRVRKPKTRAVEASK